ncbi:MAG: TonB family protein [Sphingobacteriaceae bacterium]|nr:MAG: TonB family protein [Sphingobacteriaceae bacterium]
MMRSLFTFLFIAVATACFAQKQETYFLKNDGSVVSSIDNADYTRTVTLPDKKRNTYLVTESYKNGKRKLDGAAISVSPLIFDGEATTYFENGNKKVVNKYNMGLLIGEQQEFFPNGKLYIVENHLSAKEKPFPTNVYIISNYDSLGTALVTNGKGNFKRYNAGFKHIVEEGSVKGGKPDGEWKLTQGDLNFVEVYSNGKLVSGKSTNKTGEVKTYTELATLPSYPGGTNEFLKYLASNAKYPYKEASKGTNGKINVLFFIEPDGSITNAAVTQSLTPGLDAEVVRVIKQIPNKWIPATIRGVPVRSPYTATINYGGQIWLNKSPF